MVILLGEVLDEGGDVEVVPAVDDVAVHLQDGVAHLDPAVPEGISLRVQPADLGGN